MDGGTIIISALNNEKLAMWESSCLQQFRLDAKKSIKQKIPEMLKGLIGH